LIPRANITAWRGQAPWPTDAQVEQDLVISRALVELFSREGVVTAFAFRGGTALHKLFLPQPGRYSEDIDLVQMAPGPIGPALGEIRACLDPWLGEPSPTRSHSSAALVYRFDTTGLPPQRVRLKVEINTREHFSLLGYERRAIAIDNPWFAGRADVVTYAIDELLATKLRALYQRRKGRDLYDLSLALGSCSVDDTRVAACFSSYVEREGNAISRTAFEANLRDKLRSAAFTGDIVPLLPVATTYDAISAAELVTRRLIARIR
jgi:predicted nucleotidyltransferase component of viral defense system